MRKRILKPSALAASLLVGAPAIAQDTAPATEQTSPSEVTPAAEATSEPVPPAPPAPPAPEVDRSTTTSTTNESSASSGTGSRERVQVVGSRIKRLDVEGPQPVEVISKEMIDKSGATEISSLLRDHSVAASFGGYRSQVNLGETPGVSGNSISLRGLGEKNTLVLLNGKRLSSDGVSGGVDVNTIPVAAIERVEILKDGASAIYGSDAAGGVVNIVTKKDFQGWSVGARYDATGIKGGDTSTYNIAYGYVGDKFSSTTVASFRKAEPVADRDVWYIEPAPRSSYAFPANVYTESTGVVPSPECPTELISPANGRCLYDYTQTSQVYPKTEQLSFLNTSEYQLNDKLTLFGRALYSENTDKHNMAPNAAEFTVGPDVAAAVANPAIPDYVAGESAQFLVRSVGLGNRGTTSTVKAFDVLAGIRGELDNGYSWESSVSTGRQRIEVVNDEGYARISAISNLITSGAYNPLSAANPGAIAPAAYVPWTTITTNLNQFDANITGELFDLSGGVASFNTGVTIAHETYKNNADTPSTEFDPALGQSDVLGASATVGDGERTSQAVYAELVMPVTKELEVDLAARFDNYNDAGSSLNPKLALAYRPIQQILIRGSAGTGFKAPQLRRLFMSLSEGRPYVYDYRNCRAQGIADNDCPPEQVQALESGNDDLKEEKSESYNAGIMFEPLDWLNFGTEFWMTKIKDAIPDRYDYVEVMKADANGVDLAGYGINIQRNAQGEIASITAPLQNLAREEIKGWDTTLGMNFNLGGSQRISYKSDYGVIQSYNKEDIPGAGMTSRLEEFGYPKWRLISNIAYTIGGSDFTIRNSQIAKHRKEGDQTQYVSSYSTWDAQYQYRAPWRGTYVVGVNNAFNKNPPRDDTQADISQVANTLYSLLERTYYFGVTQEI